MSFYTFILIKVLEKSHPRFNFKNIGNTIINVELKLETDAKFYIKDYNVRITSSNIRKYHVLDNLFPNSMTKVSQILRKLSNYINLIHIESIIGKSLFWILDNNDLLLWLLGKPQ